MQNPWVRNGADYEGFVERAAADDNVFSSFRRQRIYQSIVETLDEETGRQFFDAIVDPDILALCSASQEADLVGAPLTYAYGGALLSPTTPRYGKVLNDLLRLFPDFISMKSIAEIGIGYGGQARFISEYMKAHGGVLETYTGIDLPGATRLTQRYFDELGISEVVRLLPSGDRPGFEQLDLVLSNYAFSEFDRELQRDYLEKVILKARSGYLTMNSGLFGDEEFGHKCFPVEELLDILPGAVLMRDRPSTSPNNYVILFGNHAAGQGVSLEVIRMEARVLEEERWARRHPFQAKLKKAFRDRLPALLGIGVGQE